MDPRYEFEAPKFVDFTKLGTADEEDHGVDSFFDVDMETGQAVSGKIAETFEEDIGISQTTTVTQETVMTSSSSASTQGEDPSVRKPKNLVTSWGNLKVMKNQQQISTTTSTKTTVQQISKSSETNAVDDMRKRLRQDTPSRQKRREAVSETISNVRNSPLMKPKRLATNNTTPRLNNSQVDSHKQINKLRNRSKSPGVNLPRTPEAMRRFKNKMAAGFASKQGEIKIKSGSSSLLRPEHQPMKPKVPMKPPTLTQSKEFNFATSQRLKSSGSRRRSSSVPDTPNFTGMLRKYTSGSGEKSSGPLKLTKPEPFPRAEARKRQHSADGHGQQFNTFAEQVNKYQKGTPDRFRSKPRGRSQSPMRMKTRSSPQHCTIPQSPALSTRGRSRPNHVLSQAERDALELAEAQKHQFHAQKVGENVPKYRHAEIEHRPCTIPEPFKVASKMFSKPLPQPEQRVEFHSNPVNKKIMQGIVGVPPKHQAALVHPESPAFRLKERLATRKHAAEPAPEPERIPRAKPVPHYGVPVSLPPASKRSTVPAPFSFSERDQHTVQKKEERIKKIFEDEKAAREFHANPINKGVVENQRLPERKIQPPTQAKPFNLKIEERVETRLNKWQEDIKKELDDQRKAANFKANEPRVLHQAPFMIKPSDKPLSELSNFTLHSDRRAEDREKYERERLRREVDLEQAKREGEVRRKHEQADQVAKMRKQAVHKAQPIKVGKPVQIRPSEKPLTNPVSPRITARGRANSTFTRGNSSLSNTQTTI